MPLDPQEFQEEFFERLDGMGRQMNAQIVAMKAFHATQTETLDLLKKVHEAVTKEADGEALHKVLSNISAALAGHTEVLKEIKTLLVAARQDQNA